MVYDPDAGIEQSTGELATAYNTILPAQNFSVDLDLPDGKKITVTEAKDEEDGIVKPLTVAANEEKVVVFRFADNGTFIGASMSVRDWGTGDDQEIIF